MRPPRSPRWRPLCFFSADFYKGRGRLRGENFFRSTGAGRARGGVTEGGGSVCPFVCVSRKLSDRLLD